MTYPMQDRTVPGIMGLPASEVWIKIGGDKGGGSFKMNFQIVKVAAPNSVHNTCVFCCYEASDTVTNLQGMKWR